MSLLNIKIERKVVDEERIEVLLSSQELNALILEGIARRANVTLGRRGVTTKITFEDETSGSPTYKTGTKARVTITVDHAPKALAEDASL
jgi:hypothetical protein